MSLSRAALATPLGWLGRAAGEAGGRLLELLAHIGALWTLFLKALYFSFISPVGGFGKLRRQLFPMMSNVGVRS